MFPLISLKKSALRLADKQQQPMYEDMDAESYSGGDTAASSSISQSNSPIKRLCSPPSGSLL
jgi:hypothetical protein